MWMSSSHWLKKVDRSTALTVLETLARREIDRSGVFREPLAALLARGDYRGFIEYSVDTAAPIMDQIHARQAVGFLEKWEPLGAILGIDREAEALVKFRDSEVSCKKVNDLIRTIRSGEACFTPALTGIFARARGKISRILGPRPPFSSLQPYFGPGASTTVPKRKAVPSEKVVPQTFACSPGTVPYLESILLLNPALLTLCRETEESWQVEVAVHAGRLQFVPKDAKTYRSIVVEPSLTGFYQNGIGRYMRSRLKKIGIDLRDQTPNQRAAYRGSIDGSLATLDLSSASDTISYELVRELLPWEWFDLLRSFRSKDVVLPDGSFLELEKFSSMGNGYTFPLETLIFYALMWSVAQDRHELLAYGDDLVCSTRDYAAVVDVLTACGFTVNAKKSFAVGPFRESCGKDYVRGILVRPLRQKKQLDAASLFIIHNFYVRQMDNESAAFVLDMIHPALRIFGPDGYGDGHLIGDHEPRPYRRDDGWAGHIFETYVAKSHKSVKMLPGDYVALLYTVYSSSSGLDGSSAIPRIKPTLDGQLIDSVCAALTDPDKGAVLRCENGRLVKTYRGEPTSYKRIRVYTLS